MDWGKKNNALLDLGQQAVLLPSRAVYLSKTSQLTVVEPTLPTGTELGNKDPQINATDPWDAQQFKVSKLTNPKLAVEEKQQLEELLKEYQDVFAVVTRN